VGAGGGYVELETFLNVTITLPFVEPRTNLLLGGIEASGRFAVGMPAGPCAQ
jgi:hypothetical protein